MGRRIAIAAGLVAIAGATAVQARPPAWQGRYVYVEPLGRDGAGAGNAIAVRHQLTLGRNGACRLDATGYQTDTHILCTATPVKGGVQVRFRSYVGGGTRNQYGVQVYRPGAPLLTLTQAGGGIVTRFQGYRIETGGTGRFFVRT